MEAKCLIPLLPVAILGCVARFGLACQDSSVYIYIYIYWLRFARKPLYRHIYMYMGHIRPIQALHTYIYMPYICLLPSFACEYALCPLHIPFWHVASFRPTSSTLVSRTKHYVELQNNSNVQLSTPKYVWN